MNTIKLNESNLRKLIENIIDEMAYPASFNMNDFKAIRSYSGRMKYCEQHLRKLASGSGRTVFQIDNEKALKLAKNEKGIAQNESEADMGYNEGYFNCIAKVLDYDDNYTFIEMELARKCSASEFKNIVGYDVNTVMEFIDHDLAGDNRYPYASKKDFTQEQINAFYDNEFINDIIDFVHTYDLGIGDLGKLSSYGIVKRDGQDELVIVDFGLTQEVAKNHYSRR